MNAYMYAKPDYSSKSTEVNSTKVNSTRHHCTLSIWLIVPELLAQGLDHFNLS